MIWQTVYHPQGGVCLGCDSFYSDCSRLDFKKMPVIEKQPGSVIVRCTEYNSASKEVRA